MRNHVWSRAKKANREIGNRKKKRKKRHAISQSPVCRQVMLREARNRILTQPTPVNLVTAAHHSRHVSNACCWGVVVLFDRLFQEMLAEQIRVSISSVFWWKFFFFSRRRPPFDFVPTAHPTFKTNSLPGSWKPACR